MDEHKIFQLCARFTVWIAIRNSALQFPFFFTPESERESETGAFSIDGIHLDTFQYAKALECLKFSGRMDVLCIPTWIYSPYCLRLRHARARARSLSRLGCVFVVSRSLGAWARNFKPFAPAHRPRVFIRALTLENGSCFYWASNLLRW